MCVCGCELRKKIAFFQEILSDSGKLNQTFNFLDSYFREMKIERKESFFFFLYSVEILLRNRFVFPRIHNCVHIFVLTLIGFPSFRRFPSCTTAQISPFMERSRRSEENILQTAICVIDPFDPLLLYVFFPLRYFAAHFRGKIGLSSWENVVSKMSSKISK